MEYAARCPRFAAWVIDVIIATVLLWLVLAVIAHSGVIETFSGGRGLLVAVAYILIQVTIGVGYFVALTAVYGATLGKMAMGMKVVNAGGARPGFGTVLLRESIVVGLPQIATIMLAENDGGSPGPLIIVIVVFSVLFDDRRQGLHDKAARTFVARR